MQVLAFQRLLLPDGIDLPDYRVNGSLALQSTLFGRYGKACSDVPAEKIAHYLARMHLRACC